MATIFKGQAVQKKTLTPHYYPEDGRIPFTVAKAYDLAFCLVFVTPHRSQGVIFPSPQWRSFKWLVTASVVQMQTQYIQVWVGWHGMCWVTDLLANLLRPYRACRSKCALLPVAVASSTDVTHQPSSPVLTKLSHWYPSPITSTWGWLTGYWYTALGWEGKDSITVASVWFCWCGAMWVADIGWGGEGICTEFWRETSDKMFILKKDGIKLHVNEVGC